MMKVVFIPDYVAMNQEAMDKAYQLQQKYNSTYGIKTLQDKEDYETYVMLHELGHIKNNSTKAMEFVDNTLLSLWKEKSSGVNEGKFIADVKFKQSKKYKALRELVSASMLSRELSWTAKFKNKGEGLSFEDKVNVVMEELTTPGWQRRGLNYLGNPAELLADGAAYITNPSTREIAAKKFPSLAKIFNETGALAKAWNPTKAFYNSRTKEVYSSYLPGIRDIDKNAKVS